MENTEKRFLRRNSQKVVKKQKNSSAKKAEEQLRNAIAFSNLLRKNK